MKKQNEDILLQRCRTLIENKLGWGSADLWHNEVYTELSEAIRQETNVLLSPTTLKRVWGRLKYQGTPSISTLNTLAQFAGYLNWRDFKQKGKLPKAKAENRKKKSHIALVLMSSAFLLILLISLFSMINLNKSNPSIADLSQIQFSSQPVTEGIPNTVIFNFDLGSVRADSISIQQSWDTQKSFGVKANQKQATGIYYYPGYFRAKLLLDGKIVKEHDLFVKSDSWMGAIDYRPIPKYVDQDGFLDEKLAFSSSIIDEIAVNETPVGSSFHKVQDFGNVSGDNITFNTSIRNAYKDKWAVCQNINILLLGTEGAFILPFSITGCVSDISLMLNDLYLNGKEHDLSAFGADFSEFRNVHLEVKDKKVLIALDGKTIFEGAYSKSIGKLVGVRYRFLGAGEVRHVSVADANGESILNDTFGDYK